VPVPVAKWSKARVCGRSLAEIAGSKPAGSMDVCLFWVFMLSSRGLCDGPIPRTEESYRLPCFIVCDRETSRMRRPWLELGCCDGERRKTMSTYYAWKFLSVLNMAAIPPHDCYLESGFHLTLQDTYKAVQIWPGRFVYKQVTLCPGHIWTTLYILQSDIGHIKALYFYPFIFLYT
jgi:hypothetical protein